MGDIGFSEILLIAIVILVFFGGKKIPEMMRGLGRGVREFNDAKNNIRNELENGIKNSDQQQTQTQSSTLSSSSTLQVNTPPTAPPPSAQ